MYVQIILFCSWINQALLENSREKYFEGPDQAIDEKVEERLEQKRDPWHLVKCTTMGRWGCDTVMVVGEALPSFTSRRLRPPHNGLCSSWGTSGSAGPADCARQQIAVE